MSWRAFLYTWLGGVRKNLHLPYYLHGVGMLLTPRWLTRWRRDRRLSAFNRLSPEVQAEVRERVDYYCRLRETTPLPPTAPTLGQQSYRHKRCPSVYFFDTYEWNRFFPANLHWQHDAGDVNYLETSPTIVKSRPIAADEANAMSVLINQDKVRHFMFFRDPIPLSQKENRVIFRGAAKGKQNRELFVRLFSGNPRFDIRDTAGYKTHEQTERGAETSIYDHLRFKFIMCLEGNDVASNLKWVMHSNSIAVSPPLTCETWFMEGRLLPDVHYIAVKEDFSDLEERIDYYVRHPEKAEAIVRNAHDFCRQFLDTEREELVSLMTMDKYFRMTGQEVRPSPPTPSPLALVWNLALAYGAYALCRLIYWAENAGAFADVWSGNSWKDLLAGCWRFDSSAIMYTNALYALMMLVPLRLKEGRTWQRVAKWVFMVVNGLAVCLNLADAAYFPYTGRRTTTSVFSEFSSEGNLFSVFGVEVLRHWYLVVAAIALLLLLWRLYLPGETSRGSAANLARFSPQPHEVPSPTPPASASTPRPSGTRRPALAYYLLQVVCLVAFLPLCIGGMRGGLSHAVRPITISNANQYVARPTEAALVLNTPFSLLRTWGKAVFITPAYYGSEAELEKVYVPLHEGDASVPFMKRNVVVLIVESFGREYIGALNPTLEGGTYRGYTPFVDELCDSSATFRWSFANGRKSIDGMPSILSSIPMFVEPFFLTPASMNDVGGLAAALGSKGYETAFFHGAENGSMGFQAFARKTGFQRYYGRTEYSADKRFGGDRDFDGMWAIWDEPFLQFYAQTMTLLREPFLTAVFTASSHHPYAIPEAYRDTFPEEGIPIHKCIRYTDHALRRFFQTARSQPWFQRTLFVLTSDHTNLSDHPFYQTDLGAFCAPILFYDPSGQLLRPGTREAIAQQTDIMPSVLGLLGYDRPYIAFGCDLFQTPADSTWAVNYAGGIYQYVKHGLLLQFDPAQGRTRAVYELTDSLLRHNIIGRRPEQTSMERELKAIVQQYMSRMNENRLTVP